MGPRYNVTAYDDTLTNTTALKPCGSYPCLAHLTLGQNGRLFADDIFNCIFVNEKFGILFKISLKLVKGPIN